MLLSEPTHPQSASASRSPAALRDLLAGKRVSRRGTPPMNSRWDFLIETLLYTLLTFAPLAYGAVETWAQMIVLSLAGAMGIALALKLAVRREARLVWTWAYLPLA